MLATRLASPFVSFWEHPRPTATFAGSIGLVIRSAYLRVYLPADTAGTWSPHRVPSFGTIVRASNHFVWGETTTEDAFSVEWQGRRHVCPRNARLRMLEGVLAFSAANPGTTLVPDITLRHAADELAELRSSQPGTRSYILTSPWHVPLRWFLPFVAGQRDVYDSEEGLSVRFRTSCILAIPPVTRAINVLESAGFEEDVVDQVRDLERWLREFPSDAMLELDYASVAGLFTDGDLVMDDSVEKVAASIDALERLDYEAAGRLYAEVAGHWAQAQALMYVN